ncbi:MAG: hypothetical protein ACLQVM_17360 [Terriglobia bacterium]
MGALAVSSVTAQETNSGQPTSEQQRQELKQALQQALRNTRRTAPEIAGSLRLYSASNLLTTYSVEVTDDHSPDRAPREIRITMQKHDGSTVLYDKREQDIFLYMFPLDAKETLLSTVWSSATTPNVRVFRIRDADVKLVMEDSSLHDAPQFVVGEAIVLLGRGREMRGNLILPTQDQIWQWSSRDDKFVLRATVPYRNRWTELGKLPERRGPATP